MYIQIYILADDRCLHFVGSVCHVSNFHLIESCILIVYIWYGMVYLLCSAMLSQLLKSCLNGHITSHDYVIRLFRRAILELVLHIEYSYSQNTHIGYFSTLSSILAERKIHICVMCIAIYIYHHMKIDMSNMPCEHDKRQTTFMFTSNRMPSFRKGMQC